MSDKYTPGGLNPNFPQQLKNQLGAQARNTPTSMVGGWMPKKDTTLEKD